MSASEANKRHGGKCAAGFKSDTGPALGFCLVIPREAVFQISIRSIIYIPKSTMRLCQYWVAG
jgi:hypothetical protein